MLANDFTLANADYVTRETIEGVEYLTVRYDQRTTRVTKDAEGRFTVEPVTRTFRFRTKQKVPKMGLMMVGLGGNNGTTVTAGILANKHNITWEHRLGTRTPNFYGSVSRSSTVQIGDINGEPVYVPFNKLAPLVDPVDVVVGGWDISGLNMADATARAAVLDYTLQEKLRPYLEKMVPLPSVYDEHFIAANQRDRADNLIPGTRAEQVAEIRRNIRDFKAQNELDTVVVLWTATTECYADITPGLNDTWANLERSIAENRAGIAPSTLFGVAALLEGAPFINGSPQNTLVPGLLDLAEATNIPVGGSDFKSGQTKMKSALVEFLTDAGIKPVCIASYNHLGNNDGRNLSSPQQFRSKELSKANVIDDMIAGNEILYPPGTTACPDSTAKVDHCIVIKYLPLVGDSKRALDEYTSEIFLQGRNTISMHNTCEDSLLAAPIILDLAIFTELTTRVTYQADEDCGCAVFKPLHPICTLLSYFTKAPLPPQRKQRAVLNALSKQRMMLVNFCRIISGLPPETYDRLSHLVQLEDAEVPGSK